MKPFTGFLFSRCSEVVVFMTQLFTMQKLEFDANHQYKAHSDSFTEFYTGLLTGINNQSEIQKDARKLFSKLQEFLTRDWK